MPHTARILYIIPNKFWGGGQQYIYELSEQLHERLLCELHYIGRDVPVCREKYSPLGTFTVLPLKSVLDLYSIFRLGYYMRKKHITVTHAHLPKDVVVAVLAQQLFRAKCKIIITRHLVRPGKFNLLYRWAYKHIDKYIFVSHTAQQSFFANSPANLKINNCIVYNGVKGSRVPGEPIRLHEKYNLPATTRIIGYAGRLAYDKGPGILIQAFAQANLPDTVLVFAGNIEDNYAPLLTEILTECPAKDKIFFHPYIEDIYDFIRQTDIIVIPSITQEACSLTLLESMQQAKAIITTNNGSQPEIVTDRKEALLVPPADPEALAKALKLLISNPELRKSLGEKAMKRSEAFSYDHFFKQMTEIYGIV